MDSASSIEDMTRNKPTACRFQSILIHQVFHTQSKKHTESGIPEKLDLRSQTRALKENNAIRR